MRIDNPAFAAKNGAASKRPFFVVGVEFAAGDIVYIKSHADALAPEGATVLADCRIKGVGGTSQKIDPDKGVSTIGNCSFDLVDVNGSFTALARTKLGENKGLRHKRVRFYQGWEGLESWDDYVLFQTQRIETATTDGGTYSIACEDVQRAMREEIFEPKKTALTATIEPDATTIPVYQTAGFEMIAHGASFTDAPGQTVGYIMLGSGEDFEVIRYTGKTETSFTGCARGVLGTRPRRWEFSGENADNGTKVEEYVYLELPAVKLIYALLTGTLYNQPGAVLPSHWHLGIDAEYVHLPDYVNIGADWWDPADDTAGRIVRFERLKKEKGQDFIEEQLCLLLGAFMPVRSDGALGLTRMTGVLSDAAYVARLDASNVVKYGALKHDMKATRNRYLIEWNWNPQREEYTRKNLLIDATSISRHGEAEVRRLKFRGLHGSRHSYTTLKNQFDALRDRYAGPPERISLQVLPSQNVLDVGDVVRVDLTQLPDYNGTGSLDRAFEVQQVRVNWKTGRVDLELFGSSEKAEPLPEEETGLVVPSSWYTSAGTDLATLPGVTSSGGVVTITANLHLTGAESAADAIYYADGDLTIANGVTVTYDNNVQIRYKGFLTVNGKLDGKGRGHPGGVGNSGGALNPPETLGTNGFLGGTITSQWGADRYSPLRRRQIGLTTTPARGQHAACPSVNVRVAAGTVVGIPADLRGTSGPGGSPLIDGGVPTVPGSDGGAGGAGLVLIGRGMDFGASGELDCSGNDSAVPGSATWGSGETVYAGAGGGGAPGAVYMFLDGTAANIPDLVGHLVADHGQSRYQGSPEVGNQFVVRAGAWSAATVGQPEPAPQLGTAAARIQYITSEITAAPDEPETADDPLGITLVEHTNTPRSPAGNLSTISVYAEPPSDDNYSYAIAEYRLQGATGWQTIGPAQTEAVVVVPSDGSTYEFRIRAVSKFGEANPSGPVATITVTDVINPPAPSTPDEPTPIEEVLPVPNVRGLELYGQGNDTEYVGRDPLLVWREASTFEFVELGYEPPAQGAGAGAKDLYFKDYEVRIYDVTTGELRRTEHTQDPAYTYAFEKNVEDSRRLGQSGPVRTWRAELYMRGRQNQLSARAAKITVSNPAPTGLNGVSITAGITTARFGYTPPSDPDFAGVKLYLSTESGFTPSAATLIHQGPDASVVIEGLTKATTYYLRFVPYDAFGDGSTSSEYSFTTNQINSRDIAGLSEWATRIDPLDRDWITEKLLGDSIPAEKIENLTVAKLTAGIAHILFDLESEGEVRVTNGGYQVRLGAHQIGSDVWLLSAGDGTSVFAGFDELGRLHATGANISGTVTITGGSGYANLTDKPASLAEVDSAASTKLGTIAEGADVTKTTIDGGLITTGYIQLATAGNIRSGKASYADTASGWWLGNDAGTPKLHIGGASQWLKWDGSALELSGNITGSTITGSTLQTATTGQRFIVSAVDGEAHFYGDRGDGTIEELATVGISETGSDWVIGRFGSSQSTHVAINAEAKGSTSVIQAISHPSVPLTGAAITASSDIGVAVIATTASGAAVIGQASDGGYGGRFNEVSGTAGAPILIAPRSTPGAPTHAAGKGALAVDSNGVLYINISGSTVWQKVGTQ